MEEQRKVKIKIWVKSILSILLLVILVFIGACFTTININGFMGGGLSEPYKTIMNWFFNSFLLIVVILVPYLLIRYFRNQSDENKKILIYVIIIIFIIWLVVWISVNYFHCSKLLEYKTCTLSDYLIRY